MSRGERRVAVQASPSGIELRGRQNGAEVSQAELPVAPLIDGGLSGSTSIHSSRTNQLLYVVGPRRA